MKLDDVKIDVVKQEEGAWVGDIPEFEGVRLKVRGINNHDYRKLERKLISTMPRSRRSSTMVDPDEQDRITNQCLFQTCLLDWDGITDTNGSGIEEPVPYSKDMARKLIFEPEYRRFRDAVHYAASIVVERSEADREDITKN